MLKKIRVEAFKSIESVELELGLVNVFIGANGSGKSNLLEALGVLGAAAGGRVDDESLLRRGVRPGVPALYKSSFKGSKQPKNIRFSAEASSGSYAVGLYNPIDKPKPAWTYSTELLNEGDRKIVGRSPRTKIRLDPEAGYAALKSVELDPSGVAGRLLRQLREYAIFSPDTATLRGLDSDTQPRNPVGLAGGRLADAVSEMFGSARPDYRVSEEIYFSVVRLIGWARGLGASDASDVPLTRSVNQPTLVLRFRDKYMSEGRNYLSGYDASEGALYVLFMAVLAHHRAAPEVLAVDNFDHALNPRLARALTRELCEWVLEGERQQLLLTSHNPLVLDGLPLNDDRVRLFTVQRTSQGKTVVRRVEFDEALRNAADQGVSLSQQWVLGSLGGVPSGL